MIVSTKQDKPQIGYGYPKLMVGTSGSVYLVSHFGSGTVLSGPYMGQNYENLIMDSLKDYHGSITLTNGRDE